MSILALTILLVVLALTVEAFTFHPLNKAIQMSSLNMVAQYGSYVPDGLTAEQWSDIRMKETLSRKGNLGAVGIQKFKSRSMQAFQEAKEAGQAKHLFPVNTKTTPMEERPYMMRRGGDWEAIDLQQKGLQPKKQATASARLATDDKYDALRKAGLLNSISIFASVMGGGKKLPWTIDEE